MHLDARLSLAYELYDPCELGADVGTDHARLPIALLRGGKCGRMILTDISPDALQNARENIGKARLADRADLRLGDGLDPLTEPCGMISILGMGGRTIQEMLTARPERLRGAALLLSAHTDLPLVRRAVRDIGYRLISEDPCLDEGRFYLIMKAVPGEEPMTEREIRLGKRLSESASPVLRDYLRHRRQVLAARLAGLQRAGSPDEEQMRTVREDLSALDGLLG